MDKIFIAGLDSLPSRSGSVRRKNQLQAIQEMETKQLKILFGVCILFVACHTCRILLNIEDLYLRLINGIDPTKSRPCNAGCASYYSFWSHVSKIIIRLRFKVTLVFCDFNMMEFNLILYFFFIIDNGYL